MGISAAQVKELRDKTGAGMMDCKKALNEANGDFESAIEILRKKGASVAAKRAERDANEGLVQIKIWNEGKAGAIIEVNCETDFVAKSDDFIQFSELALNTAIENKPTSVEELLTLSFDGKNIGDELNSLLGKIGEKIQVARFNVEEDDDALFVDYIHHGAKLGVMVKVEKVGSADREKLVAIVKDIAMQAAAMMPQYVCREEVPQDAINKEMEIYKEVARKEGKPEQILEKIAMGKLNKYYQEICLLEQVFVKDNSKAVGDLIKEFNKENSSEVQLTKFYRYRLGDK